MRQKISKVTYVPRGNVPETKSSLPPLTEIQRGFVRKYVMTGGSVELAAVAAGVKTKDPAATAREWLWRPEVLVAIREEQKRAALLGGSVALQTLVAVAQDQEQSGTARVAAAKALASFSLAMSTGSAADSDNNTKPEGNTLSLLGDNDSGSKGRELLMRLRRVIYEEHAVEPVHTTGNAKTLDVDPVHDVFEGVAE